MSSAARGRRWRRIAAAGLAAAAGAGLLWYVAGQRSAPRYLTAEVSRGDVLRTVTASGTVNPVTTVQVGSYVSGVVQDLHCDFNTRVKAGQLCARIDPRPFQVVVDEQAASLATARAQLAKDQANLEFSGTIYERDKDLLARRIVSQETVDTALNALEQARAQVALDQATVAERVASLDAARVNLGYTNIVSPVDGVVVSRNVTQGQTVASSFQTPTLFLIATDLTRMQVDTNVSEADIGSLAVGQRTLFTVEAYPERTFAGSVSQVRQAPQSVQNVITYDAVVDAPNPDLLLKPGMTASVRIITAEHRGVLRVPDQALRFTPPGAPAAPKEAGGYAQTALWRLEDGRPVRIAVTVGLDDGTSAEVSAEGLAAGDKVIVGLAANGERPAGAAGGMPRMPRL